MRFRPGRWRHSLRGRLLAVLLLAIVLAAALQAAVVYRQARAEADAIFDYHLEQMAQALRAGVAVSGLPVLSDDLHGGGPVDFVVQVWSMEGLQVYRSSDRVGLPQRAVLGFSEAELNGRPFRVFALQTPYQVIQIAQDMGPRGAMAGSLALRTVMPIVWMAPMLMLVAWWAVGASLRPVARVREQVAARAADDLATVSEAGLPDEIRPLVKELNLLFERVRVAFEAQQHFVVDAAHELRSPLAALRLQAQGLQRAKDDATRQVAVERLLAGIDRATRLVEQLLVLARHQAVAAAPGALSPVALDGLAREVVSELAPRLRSAASISVCTRPVALRYRARPKPCASCCATWWTTPSNTRPRVAGSMCRWRTGPRAVRWWSRTAARASRRAIGRVCWTASTVCRARSLPAVGWGWPSWVRSCAGTARSSTSARARAWGDCASRSAGLRSFSVRATGCGIKNLLTRLSHSGVLFPI